VLVIAVATGREAAPLAAELAGDEREVNGVRVTDGRLGGTPVRLCVTGVGRGSTAFHLGRVLLDAPTALLQVGIGGGFDAGPDVGEVALAAQDSYADLGAATEAGWLPARELGFPLLERDGAPVWDTFPTHVAATGAAAGALAAPIGPFVTLETVTGTTARAVELSLRHAALVESMEGAAAAHACALAGVPFVELRAVSNRVGPRDRAAWRIDDAIAAAGAAATRVAPIVIEAAA